MSEAGGRGEGRRKGSRMARRLGILAGAILLVGVGAVIALKVIFTPEKLRALVVPRLEAAAGRDVELASIRLRIFPRIAIRLNDVAIANPPGFASDRALRLGALELQVRLRPLLKRELELGRVRLLRPEIHYEVLADGTNNFEGLGAGAGAGAAGAAGAGGAVGASAVAGLLVSNLVIDDGRIEYSDAITGRSASFSIDARLTADRSDASARALESSGWLEISQLRARLSDDPADTVALGEARLEFDLLADFAGDSLRLREAKLRLGELPLAGSGVVRSLGGARELEFAFASGAVEISRLLAAVPGDASR